MYKATLSPDLVGSLAFWEKPPQAAPCHLPRQMTSDLYASGKTAKRLTDTIKNRRFTLYCFVLRRGEPDTFGIAYGLLRKHYHSPTGASVNFVIHLQMLSVVAN